MRIAKILVIAILLVLNIRIAVLAADEESYGSLETIDLEDSPIVVRNESTGLESSVCSSVDQSESTKSIKSSEKNKINKSRFILSLLGIAAINSIHSANVLSTIPKIPTDSIEVLNDYGPQLTLCKANNIQDKCLKEGYDPSLGKNWNEYKDEVSSGTYMILGTGFTIGNGIAAPLLVLGPPYSDILIWKHLLAGSLSFTPTLFEGLEYTKNNELQLAEKIAEDFGLESCQYDHVFKNSTEIQKAACSVKIYLEDMDQYKKGHYKKSVIATRPSQALIFSLPYLGF